MDVKVSRTQHSLLYIIKASKSPRCIPYYTRIAGATLLRTKNDGIKGHLLRVVGSSRDRVIASGGDDVGPPLFYIVHVRRAS